jgi:signal transduction histidine kinase
VNTESKNIRKYRYAMIASVVIVIAVLTLLLMQYRSVWRTRELAAKTMKASLELHLFEITEEAKRGMLDHANHIMHGVRQQRIRERDIRRIEMAFTRLYKRYPEVEDLYVVFFERGQENETWQALKFNRPDPNDPNPSTYDGVTLGKLKPDAATSESLKRAWQSIKEKESQTTLYAAFDLDSTRAQPRQYFFHTVYELDRLRRNTPLENIGLLVFSARADSFPSKGYLPKLIAKHQDRDKEVNGLIGRLDYSIILEESEGKRNLVETSNDENSALGRRFDESDRLFPQLKFGVAAPEIEAKSYANEYIWSSIFLGLVAAVVAIAGLFLTWRATQREIKTARLKSDFLASVSHELKTPLTAIRAFGDLLDSGRASKPERIREYGGIIKTESDRLTALINNILEMSRLERGARKYKIENGDLRKPISDAIDVFRHTSDGKSANVNFTPSLQPVFGQFDHDAIKQAVLNLLSNAAKYSADIAAPKIDVDVRTSDKEVIVEVRDFGVGVAAAEQRDIFLPFQRSDSDGVQSTGGSGLGLAIVREILRGHGGDVSVESELGKGSVFRLHLPKPDETTTTEFEVNDGIYLGYRG